MKQTAVEWLKFQINSIQFQDPAAEELYLEIQPLIDQAKAMEKEQIMDAVYYAMGTNFDPNMGRAELYYNTTFKSE